MPKLKTIRPRIATIDARIARAPTGAGASADQRYDAQRRRDSATRALYGSRRWKARRAEQLRIEPLCRRCKAEGIVCIATVADHIEPHRGDVEAFWTSPLQSLCARHHNATKQREERAEQSAARPAPAGVVDRRMPSDLRPSRIPLTIVCGPPGSGITGYVHERIGPRDLLIDLDAIVDAQPPSLGHRTSPYRLMPAIEERNRLLRSLADDRRHDRAWFALPAPDPAERQTWADRLRGELVTLAVPLDECRRRIEADPTFEGERSRMLRAAEDWWRKNLHLTDREGYTQKSEA